MERLSQYETPPKADVGSTIVQTLGAQIHAVATKVGTSLAIDEKDGDLRAMKDQTNVIQFPKPQTPAPRPSPAPKVTASNKKWNPSLATTFFSLIAIAVATGATNMGLSGRSGTSDLASVSGDRVL